MKLIMMTSWPSNDLSSLLSILILIVNNSQYNLLSNLWYTPELPIAMAASPPGYNNSQEQTAREHCSKFKFSLEPYRELSLNQRKIPCFPANNSTDAHHCDIVSSRSSPSHLTKDSPFNTSQVRTRSTTKKLNHCLENQKGYYLRNRNTGKCSCCNSSQDD